MRILMQTIKENGDLFFSSFEVDTHKEARKRAYLRLSQPEVAAVNLWKKDGVDYVWMDSVSLQEKP